MVTGSKKKESNANNLNNVRRGTTGHFRGWGGRKEYLKAKMDDFETDSNNKNIGDFF